MKKYFIIIGLLIAFQANAGILDWFNGLFMPPINLGSDPRVFRPSQGGTGTSSTPTDNQILLGDGTQYGVKTLTPGSNITFSETGNTFTITGAAGGGSAFPFDPIYSGTINATSTTLGFLNGFISSGASSTISDALQLTNTKNCNTLDTDANGLLSCGMDEGSSVPNLVYKTFSGTKYFTASSTDAFAFRFADGFVSSGASSTISDILYLKNSLNASSTVHISATTTIANGIYAGASGGFTGGPGFGLGTYVFDGLAGPTQSNLLVIGGHGAGTVGINTYQSRGTSRVPTATQSGDNIYFMGGRGYGATAYGNGSKAVINFAANKNWTDANQGTRITFETTPNNSTIRAEGMRLDATGYLGIASTTPGTALAIGNTTTYINLDNTGTSTFSGGIFTNALKTNLQNCNSLDTDASGAIICGTDASGTSWNYPFDRQTWGNSTTTVIGLLGGFISSGASSTISDALNLTNTKSCNTLDTDANGLLSCGTDETGGSAGVPNLIYRTLGTTKYYTASTSATDNLAFHFNNGFISSASSSIAGTLNVTGAVTLDTALTVPNGGTGATTLTDGYVLLGSGAGAITPLDVTGLGALIYGDGATDPAVLAAGTRGKILSITTGGIPGWIATSTFAMQTDLHSAVTLAGTPNYLTLSGQQITLTKLDISDDTNLTCGTNCTLTANDIAIDDAFLINSGDDSTTGNLTALTFQGSGTGTSTLAGGLSAAVSGLASSKGLTLTGGALVNTGTATSTFTGGIYANDIKTNLPNCNTLDTDASGALICGTDEQGGGSGAPNLIYRTLGTTKFYTASSSATDNNVWHFNNGFVSSASSTIAGALNIDGDITVDVDTLFVDSTNNAVLLGTTNYLSYPGTLSLKSTVNDPTINPITVYNSDGDLRAGFDNDFRVLAYGTSTIYTNVLVGGTSATAFGNEAIAWGNTATANANNAISIGNGASADGISAIAIGNAAVADNSYLIGIGDSVSFTSGVTNAINIGDGGIVRANRGICIGSGCAANRGTVQTNGAVAIGNAADAFGDGSISFGMNTVCNGAFTSCLGYGATTNIAATSSIALGVNSIATKGYQLVIGANTTGDEITRMFLGSGASDASPTSTASIFGTWGSGTNISGTTLVLAGGRGTGTGSGGELRLATSPSSSTGTALNDSIDRLTITSSGLIGTGTTSPWGSFTVNQLTGQTPTKPIWLVGGTGTSTPYFAINQKGQSLFGTTTSAITTSNFATTTIGAALFPTLYVDNGHNGTTTVTIGDIGNPACIKIRDKDNGAWTYLTVIDGTGSFKTTSCE